jgi:NitT/TauT family transport system ATP-binding protein
MADHVIRFENVGLAFSGGGKSVLALDDVSFDVDDHEFTSIVGPSGCGKTTLLRLCAGLEFPTTGRALCHGRQVTKLNTEVGFVTQESNLFPWMTMYQNIEFPLRVRRVPVRERRERVMEHIQMVGLTGFENHYPHQLSGGMQKRASIIRTMVYEPDVVLMDEPFGPLDAQTKMLLQRDLLRVWSVRKQTILFVTHDLVEAVALSDNVVVMSARPGRVKGLFPISVERPRDVFQIHTAAGFAEDYERIWSSFKSELDPTAEPAEHAPAGL